MTIKISTWITELLKLKCLEIFFQGLKINLHTKRKNEAHLYIIVINLIEFIIYEYTACKQVNRS